MLNKSKIAQFGVTLLCVASALPVARAQEPTAPEPWSLERAWAETLRRHPALKGAQADIDAARARVDQAATPLRPTTTLEASHTQMTANFTPRPGAVPSSVNLGKTSAWSAEPYPFWQTQLAARWNVIDFGRTAAAVESAQLGSSAAQADLGSLRRQLWLNVTQAYLQVMGAEAALEATQVAKTLAEKRRDLAKKKVDALMRPALDLLRAEGDVAAAEVATIRAEEFVRASRQILGSAMGMGGLISGPLAPPNLTAEELEPARLASGAPIAAWVDSAAKTRDDFKALDARMAAAQAAAENAERAAMPSLYVAGQLSAAGIEVSHIVVNGAVSAGVSVPLGGAWLQKPWVVEARAQARSLQASRDAALVSLQSELAQALSALVQARRKRPAVETLVQLSGKAQEHAVARYTGGAATMLEVVDAEGQLNQAVLQRIQTSLEESLAIAKWLAAMGRAGLP